MKSEFLGNLEAVNAPKEAAALPLEMEPPRMERQGAASDAGKSQNMPPKLERSGIVLGESVEASCRRNELKNAKNSIQVEAAAKALEKQLAIDAQKEQAYREFLYGKGK